MSASIRPNWVADLPRKTGVAIILVAFALVALRFGGIALWVLASVAGVLMMAEWAGLAGATPQHKRLALFAVSVPLAILSPLAAGPNFFALGLMGAAGFFIVIQTRNRQLAWGVPYVVLPITALLALRMLPNGELLTLWALASVWATDIGAYFAGRLIGGPKLMPRLSPNKTWAGLGGGMVAALLVGLAFARWGGVPMLLALGGPLWAVVAQAGDLFESGLKRQAGVKDSGDLLPGHGGVLDRLDGVVPVLPLVVLVLEAMRLA